MAPNTSLLLARTSHDAPSATLGRAPTVRLAWAGVAAAVCGSDPSRIGGVAAWLGSGVQRPDRRVACNTIVGPYCVVANGDC